MTNGQSFEGCVFAQSDLRDIKFPSTLKEIPAAACWGCKNLKTVEFSEGLVKIGTDAFQESGIESLILPASLRIVSQGAFSFCDSLKTVRFADGLETLGTDEEKTKIVFLGVFRNSAVTSVELPSTL